MLDMKLVLIVFLFAVPGVLVTIPRSIGKMANTVLSRLPEGKKLPPVPVLAVIQTLQSIVLVGGLSVLGGVCAPRFGFHVPFFSAVAAGSGVIDALPNAGAVLGLSAGGSLVFLLLYYLVLRPWMGSATADAMDELRMGLGLGSRILYGGIAEEVMMRWGLMSLLAWLANLILPSTAAVWTAIVVSGVLFGLGHIPSYVAAGCEKSPALVTSQIVLNLWAGIVFGFIFWRHGLLAAMVSHMLFHLIWIPVELATRRRVAAPQAVVE